MLKFSLQRALLLVLFKCAIVSALGNAAAAGFSTQTQADQEKHEQWLREKFAHQHEQLTPIVAVADMFFACNQERTPDNEQYSVRFMVEVMNKNVLAQKLSQCLGEDGLGSEVAVNYGLLGCFTEQLNGLPEEEKAAKLKLVKTAINNLSIEERKKSLTQCVTDQAINYLK